MSEWFPLNNVFAGGWRWWSNLTIKWNKCCAVKWAKQVVESTKFTMISKCNSESGRCSFHTLKLIIFCYSHFLWLCDKLLKYHTVGRSILADTKKNREKNNVDDIIIQSASQFHCKVTKKPIQKRERKRNNNNLKYDAINNKRWQHTFFGFFSRTSNIVYVLHKSCRFQK